MDNQSQVKIGKKAFIGAALVILGLMIVSGILTMVLPSGAYNRFEENGKSVIVDGSFKYIEKPSYPFYRWFSAPVEVLFSDASLVLYTLILFLLFVGGSIAILEASDVMKDILARLVKKFKNRKYLLMGVLILLFMSLASFLGVYEGLVPLIIFIVPLAHSLGWDSLTGLGMSLLPLAFGFAAAVTNPFTIIVAQKIAELPVFSGAWLRLIFFAIVYMIVYLFVYKYAKKIEHKPQLSIVYEEDSKLPSVDESSTAYDRNPDKMRKAIIWFAVCIGTAMMTVLVSSMIPAISDYAFPVMGLLFFIGGIGSGLLAGDNLKTVFKSFLKGALNISPGILLILMAYSVKYIIDSGKITDTILFNAASAIQGSSPVVSGFLIYGLTLLMNFFIGSASAKAFLMMPILTPLADLVGITRQTAVLAFDFGDGFSNMLYPSNALLLIALGFTVVSYPKWIKWTFVLQLIMLAITSLFLLFAVLIGFGPY